jgi:hypothetical protein
MPNLTAVASTLFVFRNGAPTDDTDDQENTDAKATENESAGRVVPVKEVRDQR